MGLLSQIFNPATGSSSTGVPPTVVPGAPAPVATAPVPPPPAPSAAPAPGSSLDAFQSLWQTPVDSAGKPIVHADPLRAPVLNLDPAKIAESASKINFMNGVQPDLVAKALGGDQQAFADVLNHAVRQAVVGVTSSQGQLLNDVILSNNQRVQQALPSAVKRAQLEQQPVDNPILEHPAVAPLVNALKQAEFNKNPNANPADVHKKVVDYITGLGSAITDTATTKAEATKPAEHDWMAWSQS